jgi:hypothetical protein
VGWQRQPRKWIELYVVDMKQWFGNLTLNIAIRMVGGKRYFGTNADVDEESALRTQKVVGGYYICLGC